MLGLRNALMKSPAARAGAEEAAGHSAVNRRRRVSYDGPEIRSALVRALVAIVFVATPLAQMRAEGEGNSMSMTQETPGTAATKPATMAPSAAKSRKILYYRNSVGLPDTSLTPKRDLMGLEYLPVYEGDDAIDAASVPILPGIMLPGGASPSAAEAAEANHARPSSAPMAAEPAMKTPPPALPTAMASPAVAVGKILYYRNPMGLPDVSPTPKKDSMGMDYLPVYEGEAPAESTTVQLSPGRIQRSGVRSQAAEMRVVATPVHGYGSLTYNEGAVVAISVGVEATVDEVFVHHVGEHVRTGQPLFRVWAYNPQLLQAEVARRMRGNGDQDALVQMSLTGTSASTSRLLNQSNWPSPMNGVVIAKRVFGGQHVAATEELLRLADTSRMWVVADIPERDVAAIKPGQEARILVRGGSPQPIKGTVLFVYPEIKTETRTARVCVEVANPDETLKAEMYADVTFLVGADRPPVVAVPEGAIIDDGEHRHVLVDQGEGRFSPRAVAVGAQGDGYVEVVSGLADGEKVVTSANFLIDSEANIEEALAAFAAAARKP